MEKKGGGKARANKIKEWQKEEMQVNQFRQGSLIQRPHLGYLNTLMTMLQLILSRNWRNFAKKITKSISSIEVANGVDQDQIKIGLWPLVSKEDKCNMTFEFITENQATDLILSDEIMPTSRDDAEKEIQELEDLLRCKVCLDCDACIVFFPCRHMVTCEYCEGFLQSCPVCRSVIEEAVKINEE